MFKLFTQQASQSNEELALLASMHPAASVLLEPRIQFGDIGNFLSFLTVNESEREDKVVQLVNEMEPLVREYKMRQQKQTGGSITGINFKDFLHLLVKVDALNAFELTDKERLAVLST